MIAFQANFSKNMTLTKTLLVGFFFALLVISSCSQNSSDTHSNSPITPKLGENYLKMGFQKEFQKPAEHEVLEFFSYSCIHCFRSQKALKEFTTQKPAGVSLIHIPVAFGGNTLLSQIYYTFEAMDGLADLHLPFFNALHQEKLPIRNKNDFFAWMADKGYDEKLVRQTFNSTAVRFKTTRSVQIVNEYQINSTPNYVIDGQYKTGPAMTGSHKKTFDLITQLVQ